MFLDIYIQPNAKKSGFAGMHDGLIKIKVASAPIDNSANIELCRYLSDMLNVSKSSVEIVSGFKSRRKRLSIKSSLSELDIKNILTKCIHEYTL